MTDANWNAGDKGVGAVPAPVWVSSNCICVNKEPVSALILIFPVPSVVPSIVKTAPVASVAAVTFILFTRDSSKKLIP